MIGYSNMQPGARGTPKSARTAKPNAARPTTPAGTMQKQTMMPTPPPWSDEKSGRRSKRHGLQTGQSQNFCEDYDSQQDTPGGSERSARHAHGRGMEHEGQFPPCCFCRLGLNTEVVDKSKVLWSDEDTSDAGRFVEDLRHKMQMQVKRSQAYMEFMSKDMPALHDWIVSRRNDGQHWSESAMARQVKAAHGLETSGGSGSGSGDLGRMSSGWNRQESDASSWSRQNSGMMDMAMDRAGSKLKRLGTGKFASGLEAVLEPDSQTHEEREGGAEEASADSRSTSKESAGVAQNIRRSLVMALFEGLDDSGSHLLGFSEMRQYAILTGFDGDDDDWMTEYMHLCEENGWNRNIGAHAGQFSTMIGDPNNRCYASNEVLVQMLLALRDMTGRDIRIPEPDALARILSEGAMSDMGELQSFAPMPRLTSMRNDADGSPSFSGHGGERGILEVSLPMIVKGASNETQSFLKKMMTKDLEFQKRRVPTAG